MVAPGTKRCTASAATTALLCPTCRLRNKNCRFRLLVSMVSRSICARSHGVRGEGQDVLHALQAIQTAGTAAWAAA